MSEGPPAQTGPPTGAGVIPSQRDWSPARSVGKNGRLRNGTRCRVKCSSVYRSARLGGGGRGRASARTWGAGGGEGEEEPGWGCHTAFHSRASYLPFVPFDPFPSTRFIVSFTLLRPGSRKKRRWRRGQGGCWWATHWHSYQQELRLTWWYRFVQYRRTAACVLPAVRKGKIKPDLMK